MKFDGKWLLLSSAVAVFSLLAVAPPGQAQRPAPANRIWWDQDSPHEHSTRLPEEDQPVGSQFQINSVTNFVQETPSIDGAADGSFVAVWHSLSQGHSIDGQRFHSDGTHAGAQFQVNTGSSAEVIANPTVSVAPSGDFVVAWQENSGYPNGPFTSSIRVRGFASGGTPLGTELQANESTTMRHSQPVVSRGVDVFVVSWVTDEIPFESRSVNARRFSSDGTPLGSQFRVDTSGEPSGFAPAVGMDSSGSFAIGWGSRVTTHTDVQAQRFASDGTRLGGQFQVNTQETSDQITPSLAMSSDGSFVVVWLTTDSPIQEGAIKGQRFSSSGSRLDHEFLVNAYFTVSEYRPAIDLHEDGGFVVVWDSDGSLGDDDETGSIQGQRFFSDGSRDREQFQVNTYTIKNQFSPDVAATGGGTFVVAWTSEEADTGDTSYHSIQGQRFSYPGLIFGDSFESGSTSRWSP